MDAEWQEANLSLSREVSISLDEIPEEYGALLGATFGRIAGMCEPTWWLGRNYWIGLMCYSRLGILARMRFANLRNSLSCLGDTPAVLFQEARMAGFEDGFDLCCPGYSTGLLFAADRVDALYELFCSRRDRWEQLSVAVTGYGSRDVRNLMRMVEEALLWASREGCGLLEGDELVGGLGYR